MKVRYLLKKRGKKGSLNPIYIALYLNDETELIYTGEKCLLKDWSENERLPKDHKGQIFFNIEKVRHEVNKVIQSFNSLDRIPTPSGVKDEYQSRQSSTESSQIAKDSKAREGRQLICRLAEKWKEDSLFSYQPSTQKTVKQSINQFVEYLKKFGLANLERKDLSKKVITGYERYLQETRKLSNSTHGKRMKHLRWFLKTIDYDTSTIKIRNHRKGIIALTLEELVQLENVDVSGSAEKQKAKDLFLLGCYTGLRISDLKRLNETRIIDGMICMTLQKNKKDVKIPLRNEIKNILKKYGMSAPKISEQQLNESIKKVCETAEIDKILTVKTNIGGKDTEAQCPKYSLITSHTASKTFITLGHQRFGLTPAEIAAVVGKDLKTLINHYFQLPQESAIQKMMDVEVVA